jgi:hypothetical protein
MMRILQFGGAIPLAGLFCASSGLIPSANAQTFGNSYGGGSKKIAASPAQRRR